MARYRFGGRSSDFVYTYSTASRAMSVRSSATVTVWSAQTGGSQVTNLLAADGTTPITSVAASADGMLPVFYGPDGTSELWADAGGAERALLEGWQDDVNAATIATLPGTYVAVTEAPLSVLDPRVGMVGDGATDNATAFGNLASLVSSGGDVYFPKGTFLTSAGLPHLPAGARIRGAGQMVTTIKAKAGTSATLLGTADDNTQRYGVTLADFSIDGNAANVSGSADLIDLPGACDVTVAGVRIANPRGRALRWRGATGGALAIYGRFADIKVRGDQTYSQGDGVVFDSGSSDANADGLDIGFFPYGTGGLVLSGHFGAVIGKVNTWQCFNGINLFHSARLRLSDSLADFSLHYGILINGCQDIQVVNCTSREASQAAQYYDGIYITGDATTNKSKDISIVGCRSFGTGLTAAGGSRGWGQNYGVSCADATYLDGLTVNGGSFRNNDAGALNAALLAATNVKVRGVLGNADAG